MSKTFYEVLDVSADASEATIRDAYREKVKEYHPDVCDRPDAAERFKRVKRAEEVLCDPDERAAYDRLGHETYVGDGPAATSDGASSTSDATTVADVREAAARTAGREHDAGGRSAGWRERERRASQRRAADWFGGGGTRSDSSARANAAGGGAAADEDDWYGAGFDYENPGSRWTYRPPDEEDAESESESAAESESDASSAAGAAAAEDASAASSGSAGVGPTAGSGSTAGRGSTAASGTTARSSGARRRRARGSATAAGSASRHAAADAWGHNEVREHTHAVHEWASTEQGRRVPRPDWTQDDVVALAATMLLYPIFLLLAAIPAFHVSVNVVAGVATLAYVAGLLPKPSMSLPVFGTWSVGMPALLLAFDVPIASVAFVVAVGGVWVPLLFAVAVASVLIR